MTLRLIGLMSALLFLALAAFSILLANSEDALMAELERTVSTAGSGALLAYFDAAWGTEAPALPDVTDDGEYQVITKMVRFGREAPNGGHLLVAPASVIIESRVSTTPGPCRDESSGGDPSVTHEVHGGDAVFLAASPVRVAGREDDELQVSIDFKSRDGSPLVPSPTNLQAFTWEIAKNLPDGTEIPPDLDDVIENLRRATPPMHRYAIRPKSGVSLKRVAPNVTSPDDDSPGTADDGSDPASAAGADDASDPVSRNEQRIAFRMSTREYDTLFGAIRERLAILFLSVFTVGVICSVVLARRFTRPIRALDDAFRRLGEDDLDVRVDERGSGEVARLSRAFNEFTGRLRVVRDRSKDLARREKLSSLGQLAAGVAHDVRNPLHSINLTLQHLNDSCRAEPGSETEFRRGISLMRDEVRRLDGLVANFLRFSRQEAAEVGPVHLGDLVTQTAALVDKEARQRGVRIDVDIDPSMPTTEGSEESLRAALLNLVLNSLDAMLDGGSLTLRATMENGMATIEVTDTGVGIPDHDQERVFDFGYTTRDNGHGLGLAMVHQIVVEQHGGRVSLKSREGAGTTFRLSLPTAPLVTHEAAR